MHQSFTNENAMICNLVPENLVAWLDAREHLHNNWHWHGLAAPLLHKCIWASHHVPHACLRGLEHLAEFVELIGMLDSEIAVENASRRCTRSLIVDGVADHIIALLGDVVGVLHMGREHLDVLEPGVSSRNMPIQIIDVSGLQLSDGALLSLANVPLLH